MSLFRVGVLFLIVLSCVLLCLSASASENVFSGWRHFSIADPLPGSGWGTAGPAVADFDGDGDLDVVISRRETSSAYWFERIDDSTWIRHTIGTTKDIERALGSAALDIDRDGHPDVVINNVWFRNPGILKGSPDDPWEMQTYEGGGHDIIVADINRDGAPDLVTYHGEEVYWFDCARGMARTVIGRGEQNHGGIAPSGAGDLDGDGYPDIVIPGYWFKNPGAESGDWKRISWPHTPIPNATYGTSIRSWVADIDADGINDIVFSDCDTGLSHVYWVRNGGGGKSWTVNRLPDPPTAEGDVPGTGSFHSLAVADFNGDGHPDIFAGEQEDSTMNGQEPLLSMKPKGLKERGVIWFSSGGREPTFTCTLINLDNPGWHDAVAADIDGDGDIDLVSKVWNKDGENYHADYWRNDLNGKNAP